MGAASEGHDDGGGGDVDGGAGADELTEQGARGGDLEAEAEAAIGDALEHARHQGELDVEVDLHRHRRGQRVHAEEVDGVGDGVFNDHAARIAVDESGGRESNDRRTGWVRVIRRQAAEGLGQQVGRYPGAEAAERREGDAQLLQSGEVGVGGQAAVEDQFARQGAGTRLPALDVQRQVN